MSATLALADLQDDASLPMYQRIKNAIQDKVRQGEWPPGTQIPSENQLAADLNVSRMTINRPFRELTAEGILKRVHGLGTFVAEPPQHASLLELRSIAEEITAQGKKHRAEVLLLEVIPATVNVAQRLGVQAGEQLFHIVVTHFQDEVPIQVEDRYVNPALVPNFMQVDFTQTTPTEYLVSQIKPDEMEHIVQAIMPDAVLMSRLVIPEYEPCLRLSRRTWKDNTVVTSVYLTYPSSRYELSARYKP
ncbi:histidine utilization repressor [Leucothrix mucor]|uniref:histidine utilization repressor n=1 Tax=Leucothrix mucor TaxID=45248 RepID=UPI0003B35A02|nr:histidine utilization repressor [Leucothrix mucor]